MRGYELVANTLVELGIRHVFGLMGNGNLPWLSYAVDQNLFEYICVRHEATAVSAAAGYARTTGKIGVATTTHGPGLGNAFTALTAAARDNSPIVVVIGVPPLDNPTAMQRMDHATFAHLCGAGFNLCEDPEKMGMVLARAAQAAYSLKKPQVVAYYDDHFEKEVAAPDRPITKLRFRDAGRTPPADDIATAVDILAAAKKPLIIAGQGAVFAEARAAVEELGEHIGALFGDTMMSRHLFAGSPYAVGLMGISGHPMTDMLIKDADCVVAVGASLNFSQTRRFKQLAGKRVIHIDNQLANTPSFQKIDLSLIGDAEATLNALSAEWRRRNLGRREGARTPDTLERIRKFRVHREDQDVSTASGLDPRTVYMRINAMLPKDRIVVTDGGRVIETCMHIMEAGDGRSFLYCSGFAAIGVALGTAIGVAVARRDRTVVLVVGDGGFAITAQELDTIQRAGLQMLILVMNDRQYGFETRHIAHMKARGDHVSVKAAQCESLPFDGVARAYGGDGAVLATKAELDRFALAPDMLRGLYLLDVRVDPNFDPWIVWSAKNFAASLAQAEAVSA
jgi:thiamine pyrophosphate-dependent acetolactate synthase large subunit-like protein